MIYLQVNEFLIWGSSITDWIMSFGAVVAIGGVICNLRQFQTQIILLRSQIDEDRKIRKLSIRPRFIISFETEKTSSKEIYYTLKSIGAEAREIRLKDLSERHAEVSINGGDYLRYIQRDESVRIIITVSEYIDLSQSIRNIEIDTILYYSDIDNNVYSQHLLGAHFVNSSHFVPIDITDPVKMDSYPNYT